MVIEPSSVRALKVVVLSIAIGEQERVCGHGAAICLHPGDRDLPLDSATRRYLRSHVVSARGNSRQKNRRPAGVTTDLDDDGSVQVWSLDGELLRRIDVGLQVMTPRVGDIDGDDTAEIVAVTTDGVVQALEL